MLNPMLAQQEHPDVSQITDYLFVSAWPREEFAQEILMLGVRMIISMPLIKPPKVYQEAPFLFVHCPTLDAPITPIPQRLLRRGVMAALPVIERGESVMVHCNQGIHRSVAMACCILVSQGYSAGGAMDLVKQQREKADPHAKHIRKPVEMFEDDWINNRQLFQDNDDEE